MKVSLKKGLDEEQVKNLESSFRDGLFFRRVLSNWIDDEINREVEDMTKKENYGTSNWGYSQADSVAKIRSLRSIKSMLLEKVENI